VQGENWHEIKLRQVSRDVLDSGVDVEDEVKESREPVRLGGVLVTESGVFGVFGSSASRFMYCG
jgi:hypothetical protein